mmetsp:Transcript_28365/g.66585  ORF Transcript_28365/g.66585 Transcript_28365/m.66585 type:complete len:202 (-) Transcript_28365:382-987(-)
MLNRVHGQLVFGDNNIHSLGGRLDVSSTTKHLPEFLVVVANVDLHRTMSMAIARHIMSHLSSLVLLERISLSAIPGKNLLPAVAIKKESITLIQRLESCWDLEATNLTSCLMHPKEPHRELYRSRIRVNITKSGGNAALQILNATREAVCEIFRLHTFHLAMLDGCSPQKFIQLISFVRGHSILVLTRFAPDPEVNIPQEG